MNRTQKHLFRIVIVLSVILACTACGQKATTMHLVKTEGDVGVLDAKGKNIDIVDQMGLYSGYNVDTQSESYAWINLDDTKLTKMDVQSQVEVKKSEKKLELVVHSGRLFFHVTQPLSDEESLEIRTSTMMVGIRGTCGWVEVLDEDHMRVYLIEGTVECSIGQTGNGKGAESAVISGGEMADMTIEDGQAKITVAPYGGEDIPDFVQEESANDEQISAELNHIRAQDFLARVRDAFADQEYDRVQSLANSDEYTVLSSLIDADGPYYLGDTNAAGERDGVGLCAYRNGLFYYGSWVNGEREGKGVAFWLLENEEVSGYYDGEYSIYDGDWSNGAPNGQGVYATEVVLSKIQEETGRYTRTSGGFVDGLFHGEMAVEITDWDGSIEKYHGTAQNGAWNLLDEERNSLINDETGENSMTIDDGWNQDWGIPWLKDEMD